MSNGLITISTIFLTMQSEGNTKCLFTDKETHFPTLINTQNNAKSVWPTSTSSMKWRHGNPCPTASSERQRNESNIDQWNCQSCDPIESHGLIIVILTILLTLKNIWSALSDKSIVVHIEEEMFIFSRRQIHQGIITQTTTTNSNADILYIIEDTHEDKSIRQSVDVHSISNSHQMESSSSSSSSHWSMHFHISLFLRWSTNRGCLFSQSSRCRLKRQKVNRMITDRRVLQRDELSPFHHKRAVLLLSPRQITLHTSSYHFSWKHWWGVGWGSQMKPWSLTQVPGNLHFSKVSRWWIHCPSPHDPRPGGQRRSSHSFSLSNTLHRSWIAFHVANREKELLRNTNEHSKTSIFFFEMTFVHFHEMTILVISTLKTLFNVHHRSLCNANPNTSCDTLTLKKTLIFMFPVCYWMLVFEYDFNAMWLDHGLQRNKKCHLSTMVSFHFEGFSNQAMRMEECLERSSQIE